MSNLTCWEPVREMMTLREAMDRLSDDAFTRLINLRDGGWSCRLRLIYQTDDEVVVKVALPVSKPMKCRSTSLGMSQFARRAGSVAGGEGQSLHIREHRWSSFERSVALPTQVKADRANADFDNGILTITLPKAEEVRPRTISSKPNNDRKFHVTRPGDCHSLSKGGKTAKTSSRLQL